MVTRKHPLALHLLTFTLLVQTSQALAGLTPNLQVWFEAKPANAQSGVLQQGMAGGDLSLSCDTSFGPVACEWDIAAWIRWDTGPLVSVVGSLGTDLLGDTSKHVVSNLAVGNYPWDGNEFQAVNAGGILANTRAIKVPVLWKPKGPIFDAIPVVDYTAWSMRLTTTKNEGDGAVDGIDAQINQLLSVLVFDPNGPTEPTVLQFGDAPPISGHVQGGIGDDVITIHNVPEPASIGLLLLGTILASRRRSRIHQTS